MTVRRKDVAELAGVSPAVVSYVLNGGPRGVAPATRARVLAAVERLGYRPNGIARSLRVNRTMTLGLVASMVLRCDDCISYHVAQCREAGVTRDEMFETFSVGLVVGGSIVIPHLRRAVDFLDRLEQGEGAADAPDHDHA